MATDRNENGEAADAPSSADRQPSGKDDETGKDQGGGTTGGDDAQDGSGKCDDAKNESSEDQADDEEDVDKDEVEEDDRSARQKVSDWLKRPRNRLIAIAVAVLLAVALVAAVLWWLEARKWQATDNAYIRGPIARLSPGVSGNVTRVFVVDNQIVRAGQPLAAVSVGSYEVALRQAEAEVATAQAQVQQARAALVTARAQVRQAAAVARARCGGGRGAT